MTRTDRQQYEREQEVIADGERSYARELLGDEYYDRIEENPGHRCADCGEPGERTGHMGCQYPQDRS